MQLSKPATHYIADVDLEFLILLLPSLSYGIEPRFFASGMRILAPEHPQALIVSIFRNEFTNGVEALYSPSLSSTPSIFSLIYLTSQTKTHDESLVYGLTETSMCPASSFCMYSPGNLDLLF